MYDFLDGCYNASNGLNIILNPASFSDNSNGTPIGTPAQGWPSYFLVTTILRIPLFYPQAGAGSESTYLCDYYSFHVDNPIVTVGGNCGPSSNHGLFHTSYCGATFTNESYGSRLMKLP